MPLFNNNLAPGFGASGPMQFNQPTMSPNFGTNNIQPQTNKSVGEVPNMQAAMSMPIAPNSELILFDSNSDVFYRKRSDASGRIYPLEVYDYKRHDEVQRGSSNETSPHVQTVNVEYATKDDVRRIIKDELESFRSSQWKPKKEANKNV